MEHFYLDQHNPNILDMDVSTFLYIKSVLDNEATRDEFLKVLPREIFSVDKYNLMEVESKQRNISPGKWLLIYLGNCGGCVSDLIYWFEEIDHQQALIFLKEEEPLQIVEQPEPSIIVNEGQKFCITCRATGYPLPEYQWLKDNKELLLEQEQVLSKPSAKKDDGGTYVCKISKRNANSSISCLSSEPVIVVVQPCITENYFNFSNTISEDKEPNPIKNYFEKSPKEFHQQNILSRNCPESEKIVIVRQPRSHGKVTQGSLVGFKCIAKASHPVKYQWYKNGRKLDGETSTELRAHELYPDQETGNMKFEYFCEVWNEYDQIFSVTATVELSEPDDKTKYVAEDKFAFLIANDNYEAYEEDLVTPAFDVVDLTKLLNSINFKVFVCRNLGLRKMRKAFLEFCRLLVEGAYVVIFFAGHGFECFGQTYLQPIDCSENFLPEESMCTEYILEQIQKAQPAVIVLLIDACRKQPPELWNAPTKIYNAHMLNNTVYGYATSFLNGAYESAERNSYFVKHLKKYITLDKRIQDILFQVQKDIAAEQMARKIQHPVVESSLCVARKLCDELKNPPDMTYQLESWFYQERIPIKKQTQTINDFKCCFIVEIEDHMNVYLNGVDVHLYIDINEDANLDKLYKLRVGLKVPSLKVNTEVQLQNTALYLGTVNLIIKEEVLELENMQNADIKGQIELKYEQNDAVPIKFSFTLEKIKDMKKFL